MSYGIQWIAFGILAPVGLGWFVYAEMRERRREREESAEVARLNAQVSSGAGGDGAGGADVGDGAGSDGVGASTGDGAEAAAAADAKSQRSDAKSSLIRDESASGEKSQKEPRKHTDLADRYGGTRSRFEELRAEKRGKERF